MTLKDFYNYHVKKHFKTGIIVMALTFFISAIFFLLNAEFAQKLIQQFMESVGENIMVDGEISAIGLMKNNIMACLIMVLLGLIPYLFLPFLSLILNGIIIGAALGLMVSNVGSFGYLTFIAAILPHGIFEIPAMILSFALGVSLCKFLMDKLNHRPTSTGKVFFLNLSKMFLSVCIPLLIIAGLVEAYITPIILLKLI